VGVLEQDTANLNQRVAVLEQDTANLNQRVAVLEQDTAKLDQRVGVLEPAMNALSNRMGTAETNIAQERETREAQHHQLMEHFARIDRAIANLRHELHILKERVDEHWHETRRAAETVKQFGADQAGLRDEFEEFVAYVEHAPFGDGITFRQLLEGVGITSNAQLHDRDPHELFAELQRHAEHEQHLGVVPTAKNPRVLVRIIRQPLSAARRTTRPTQS
jgi:hypothetical protein